MYVCVCMRMCKKTKKVRLTRGDMQLDMSMLHSSHGHGHHVTELLSDLSYCIYKARCCLIHINICI
jgi:hypothetical protein